MRLTTCRWIPFLPYATLLMYHVFTIVPNSMWTTYFYQGKRPLSDAKSVMKSLLAHARTDRTTQLHSNR